MQGEQLAPRLLVDQGDGLSVDVQHLLQTTGFGVDTRDDYGHGADLIAVFLDWPGPGGPGARRAGPDCPARSAVALNQAPAAPHDPARMRRGGGRGDPGVRGLF
ncbi:hypothetical protein GCM10010278_22690 [Streptomyces melanogenes]|nr:hypothetical protein GCM10010278_22690 [Streptomyces melanogenes]